MNYDDRRVCLDCFSDNTLRDFIETNGMVGNCHWCALKNVKTVPVFELSEMFRAVAACYDEVTGPETYLHHESISYLLQEDWCIFSDKIEDADLLQEMTLAILMADVDPKERGDFPDYDGFFARQLPDLVDEWFNTLDNMLNKGKPHQEPKGNDNLDGFPSRLELAIEDGMRILQAGSIYWRARIHKDRKRKNRFTLSEMGAPHQEIVKAGRANRDKEPVLYLATDCSL